MSSRGQNWGAVGQQIQFHTGKPFQLGLPIQQYIHANHEPHIAQGSNGQWFLEEKVGLGDLESPFQLLAAVIL